MTILPLSPALAGLLRRGLPVALGGEATGTVVAALGPHVVVYIADVGDWLSYEREDVALDLDDPTGRDALVRWFREKGHDLSWALDGLGPLTPEQSATVLRWSALSVAAGGKPLCHILGAWRTEFGSVYRGWVTKTLRSTAVQLLGNSGGWLAATPGVWEAYGREAGVERVAAADAAALVAGFGLLDDAGVLILPALPEGA